MRHNLHFAQGSKYVHRMHLLQALHSGKYAHKKGGSVAIKKDIGSFRNSGTGIRRITPLKFKL